MSTTTGVARGVTMTMLVSVALTITLAMRRTRCTIIGRLLGDPVCNRGETV